MTKKNATSTCPKHGLNLKTIPEQKTDHGVFMERMICPNEKCDFEIRLGY